MKVQKSVLICILAVFFCCLLFAFKNTTSAENIASNAEQFIELRTGSELTQTWLADKKRICGVRLNFAKLSESGAYIQCKLADKSDGNIVRSVDKSLAEAQDGTLDLIFDTLIVEPNTQLEIQISLQQTEGEQPESVFLKANPDYSGLSIDGQAQNCGLGSSVLYRKNSAVFTVSLTIGCILIFSFCLMQIFGRNFADVVGMAIAGTGILLYVFGLLGSVEKGMILLAVLAAVGFCYLLFHVVTGKFPIRRFFSWSIFAVVIFYIFSMMYNYNVIIAESDEFSHWALAVKDMFYSNQLFSHEGTTVTFTRYPPFMALIQYYFMYINQVFSVRFLYIAYQLSGFCLLIVWAGKYLEDKRNGAFQKVLLILMTVAFPLILYPRYYSLIMIDGFLGILFAYILYCYFFGELDRFNSIRITLGLMALVLTKEMGVVLAGLACLIFMICRGMEKGKDCLKDEIKLVGMGLAAFGAFVSWQMYCRINMPNTVEKSFASATQMISTGANKLTDNGQSEFVISVILNGIKQIFDNIKVGPFSFALILCILPLIVYCVGCQNKRGYHFKAAAVLSIGGFIYFTCLLFLYVTVFPRKDALSAASLDRYLFSYLAGLLLLVMVYFSYRGTRELGILFCLILYLTPVTDVLTPNQMVEKRQELIWGYDEINENLRSFAGAGEKIFFWCDNSQLMSYRIFRFYICPFSTQSVETGCSFRYNDGEGRTHTYDFETIKLVLSDYDYVYVANYDEEARKEYLKLFSDETDLMTGRFYHVESDGDEIKLVDIGYSPIMRYY